MMHTSAQTQFYLEETAPPASRLLGANPSEISRSQAVQPCEDCRHEGPQVHHSVGGGANENYRKWLARERLLEFEVAIHSEEGIEPTGSTGDSTPRS